MKSSNAKLFYNISDQIYPVILHLNLYPVPRNGIAIRFN